MIKLGVDNGNYNTKSSEGMLYASGYAVSDKEFITPEMQLFYEGKYYAVGERRLRFQQDKTKELDTFILTLPVIAEAMKKTGTTNAEIVLGVGLPIDSYGTQKDAFRQYFLRDDLSFVFEGAAYRCRIADCKVFAQGHAALCRYYQQLKEYRSITLVDIGGYTVDVLTVHNFRLDRSSCASLRMIVYSVDPSEGYVTKPAIEKMRSSLAREIFQQDLLQIYSEQTERRDSLTAESRDTLRELLEQMRTGTCANPVIEDLMSRLAERLKYTTGKKQYGYLKAPLKELVNQIVDELAKDERVAAAYAKWQELRNEVLRTYKDQLPEPLPLSQQKEFKQIKNMKSSSMRISNTTMPCS